MDPEDRTIDIGKKPSYKGSLMVVPTPIGNLGDLSLRQYEALTTCDIIACEDTRKTGKMIEMLIEKKMKERFRNSFGTSFDSFMDSARDSVVDEQTSGGLGEETKESADVGDEDADFLFYGAGAQTDDSLLQSLIQANRQIESLP